MAKKIQYAEWNLKNDNVIVLAGSTAQETALKYNVYICQNLRSFRSSKYMTFYKDGLIEHLFEIIEKPYDYGTPENTAEYKQMVADKQVDYSDAARVFKLKYVGKVGPIKNDSVSKTGKPVPFTYGQPRYTTLDRLNAAKVTSELIKGIIEEPLILTEVGTNTIINPNNATIALSWQSNDDFDIAVVYEDKKGRQGLVFFNDKGSLDVFPYMKLDKDARGSRIFKQRETILIDNLNEMKKVFIICWDYEAINANKSANFIKKSNVQVAIEDENGFSSSAILQSDGNFNSTCIAKIENKDGFVFTNVSRGFNSNFKPEDIIKNVEE
jgi:tellurite resistance protein TerA